MSAVSRVKLGALAGRADAKALRALDDALRSFERIRARLNTQTAQVFAEMLDSLDASLKARDEPAAGRSLRSAEQLARLCHDPGLQMRKLRLEARFHMEFGDLPTALELERAVFYRGLARGREMRREDLQDALRLIVGLESVGRFREALGFVRAMQAITDGRDWPELPRLKALEGRMLVALRELPAGLAALHAAKAAGVSVELALHISYFYAGTLSFDEFRRRAARDEVRADWAMRFALWLAEPEALKAAIADYERSRRGETTTARFEPECARLLLRAMDGDAKALPDFDAALQRATFIVPDRAPWDVALPAWRCRIALALRERKAALRDLQRAEVALQATSPEVVTPIQIEAIHHANSLALLGADQPGARRAAGFMQRELSRGFLFLQAA
jgi:hypothetical protein